MVVLNVKLQGQCPTGNITLNTQQQVDDFPANYPGCINMLYSIFISGSNINNLNGLNTLNSIGSLQIVGCPALTSLQGLENVTSVGGYFGISYNSGLTSLQGLVSLETVGGSLSIFENSTLTNLQGLGIINSVGHLSIVNNSALTSLYGLTITSINGNLTIFLNGELENLQETETITYVGGTIYIQNNAILTSLSGMQNIAAGPIANLVVQGNPNLSVCELPNLCTYLSDPSNLADISGNAAGCASRSEVEAACALLPIELLSFESEEQRGDCLLTWRTASEQDNSYFEIEHSRNGISFETIGVVDGVGTSLMESSYKFLHQSPMPGVHYYRLKQYDFNAEYYYSSIISARIVGDGIRIYPNPMTDDRLNIALSELQQLDNLKLSIIGTDSKHIQQIELTGIIREWVVPFKCLTSGVYTIQITDGGGFIYRQKLVKL